MKGNKEKIVRYSSEELDGLHDNTDWEKVDALTDTDIEKAVHADPDAPELLEEEWFNKATLVNRSKEPITIRMDKDVLDFFKKQGKGYQTKINSVLRTFVEAHK